MRVFGTAANMEDKHIEDLSLNLKNNTGTNESENEAAMSSGGQHDNLVHATTSGLSNPAYGIHFSLLKST